MTLQPCPHAIQKAAQAGLRPRECCKRPSSSACGGLWPNACCLAMANLAGDAGKQLLCPCCRSRRRLPRQQMRRRATSTRAPQRCAGALPDCQVSFLHRPHTLRVLLGPSVPLLKPLLRPGRGAGQACPCHAKAAASQRAPHPPICWQFVQHAASVPADCLHRGFCLQVAKQARPRADEVSEKVEGAARNVAENARPMADKASEQLNAGAQSAAGKAA